LGFKEASLSNVQKGEPAACGALRRKKRRYLNELRTTEEYRENALKAHAKKRQRRRRQKAQGA
jgi:hypothetical protein